MFNFFVDKKMKRKSKEGKRGIDGRSRLIIFDDFKRSERESHVMVAHDIGTIVRNNCPTKWASCKKVPEKLKKSMLDNLSVLSHFTYHIYIIYLIDMRFICIGKSYFYHDGITNIL